MAARIASNPCQPWHGAARRTGCRLLVIAVGLALFFGSQLKAAAGFGNAGAGTKRKKAFGTPSHAPKIRQGEEHRRMQRLGKDPSTIRARKELLSETAEQDFKVADFNVRLLVPSYIMDYTRFTAVVESAVGTVSDIVWPGEQALALTLMQRKHLWQTNGLCELGAGLGLAGIAVAKAGAPRVLITDRDPLVLDLVQRSAARNNVQDRVTVSAFDWIDKSKWPAAFGGLVAAADVLYDKEVVAPLIDLILHLGGSALLCEPDNQERKDLGSVPYFKEMARAKGLEVHQEIYLPPEAGSSPMVIISTSRTVA